LREGTGAARNCGSRRGSETGEQITESFGTSGFAAGPCRHRFFQNAERAFGLNFSEIDCPFRDAPARPRSQDFIRDRRLLPQWREAFAQGGVHSIRWNIEDAHNGLSRDRRERFFG
jgi:hypothetical protein